MNLPTPLIAEDEAPTLFSAEEVCPWRAEWQNMPEYRNADLSPKFSLIVNFNCAADLEDFSRLIGQPLRANGEARQMQSVWFPEQEIGRMVNKRFIAL